MENKSLDRSLMIPMIIGILSIGGMVLIFLVLRVSSNQSALPLTPSATPLKFQFLATEPGVVTLIPTDQSTPTEVDLGSVESPTATSELIQFATATNASSRPTNTIVIEPSTPTQTTTPQPGAAIYDDSDFTLIYTGEWLGQTGVTDVYKNTLHLSNTIGSSVQFTFTGQKVRIAYQAGPGLGTVAIRLDSAEFALEQADVVTQISEWESPILTLISHTVTITHIGGGSINIDSIAVIDLSTATPTPTITPTP